MLKNIRYIVTSLAESHAIRITSVQRSLLASNRIFEIINRTKKTNGLTSLFKPVEIKNSQDDINIGAEITGTKVDKSEIMKILNRFAQR